MFVSSEHSAKCSYEVLTCQHRYAENNTNTKTGSVFVHINCTCDAQW